MKQERRGLRFLLEARAEVASKVAPSKTAVACVTELSLYGCYIQTSTPVAVGNLVLVTPKRES